MSEIMAENYNSQVRRIEQVDKPANKTGTARDAL